MPADLGTDLGGAMHRSEPDNPQAEASTAYPGGVAQAMRTVSRGDAPAVRDADPCSSVDRSSFACRPLFNQDRLRVRARLTGRMDDRRSLGGERRGGRPPLPVR
jgi:hypothetical protein